MLQIIWLNSALAGETSMRWLTADKLTLLGSSAGYDKRSGEAALGALVHCRASCADQHRPRAMMAARRRRVRGIIRATACSLLALFSLAFTEAANVTSGRTPDPLAVA